MKVILKHNLISNDFGVKFPKDIPLTYSKEYLSIQHPTIKSIWLKVDSSDFDFVSRKPTKKTINKFISNYGLTNDEFRKLEDLDYEDDIDSIGEILGYIYAPEEQLWFNRENSGYTKTEKNTLTYLLENVVD